MGKGASSLLSRHDHHHLLLLLRNKVSHNNVEREGVCGGVVSGGFLARDMACPSTPALLPSAPQTKWRGNYVRHSCNPSSSCYSVCRRPPAAAGRPPVVVVGKAIWEMCCFSFLFCSPSFLPLSGGPYCHFALGESEEEETAEELGGAIPPSHRWQKKLEWERGILCRFLESKELQKMKGWWNPPYVSIYTEL